jgi:GrpB-like predicted nucleotidyltransferase (UPF0157 family)
MKWFDRAGGDPVLLHDADPCWSAVAAEWSAKIITALDPTRVIVEHVGSTSVPGLVAKPVIDLQVAVTDVGDEASYRPGLESLGLVLRQRESGHRFFRPPAGQPRVVHVHVCQIGSEWEREHILFRDRLRDGDNLASDYAALKKQLAATFANDRLAYNEGKADFIRTVLLSR